MSNFTPDEEREFEHQYARDTIDQLQKLLRRMEASPALGSSGEVEKLRAAVDGIRQQQATLERRVSGLQAQPTGVSEVLVAVERLRRQNRALGERVDALASVKPELIVQAPPVTIVNAQPAEVVELPPVRDWTLQPVKRAGMFMSEVVAYADGAPAWRFYIERHANNFPKQVIAVKE